MCQCREPLGSWSRRCSLRRARTIRAQFSFDSFQILPFIFTLPGVSIVNIPSDCPGCALDGSWGRIDAKPKLTATLRHTYGVLLVSICRIKDVMSIIVLRLLSNLFYLYFPRRQITGRNTRRGCGNFSILVNGSMLKPFETISLLKDSWKRPNRGWVAQPFIIKSSWHWKLITY